MSKSDNRDVPQPWWHRLFAMLLSLLVGLVGGLLWRAMGLPLPWLVGSLYAVALARIVGLPLRPPPAARQCGQWVIGTSMGLYFSPAVASQIAAHAYLIIGMALCSLALGVAAAFVLVRYKLSDPATAFFSAMPGGASEMANLSDYWSAAVDRVAAAHSVRVMLVVLVVPLGMNILGAHGDVEAVLAARPVEWGSLAWMAVSSLGGAACFLLLGLPNAWVLGPMAVIGAFAAMEMSLSGLPLWLSSGGQCLVGIALGCRFGPGFLRKAPLFLGGIALMSFLLLLLTAVIAWLLPGVSGLSMPNLMLSFSPGGIAEMALTASHLHLDVPLVVAAHVTRLVVITSCASFAYRLFCRFVG